MSKLITTLPPLYTPNHFKDAFANRPPSSVWNSDQVPVQTRIFKKRF